MKSFNRSWCIVFFGLIFITLSQCSSNAPKLPEDIGRGIDSGQSSGVNNPKPGEGSGIMSIFVDSYGVNNPKPGTSSGLIGHYLPGGIASGDLSSYFPTPRPESPTQPESPPKPGPVEYHLKRAREAINSWSAGLRWRFVLWPFNGDRVQDEFGYHQPN